MKLSIIQLNHIIQALPVVSFHFSKLLKMRRIVMTNDYSKWYYWYAFWKQESSNKIECTMMRMSILYPMTQMIKVFQQNKSKLSFKPDSLMIGRSSTATEGMRIYDTDATDEALKLYLNKQL